jgi:cell division protein FtsA
VDVVNNPIYATGVGLLLHGFKSGKVRKQKFDPVRGIGKMFTGGKLLDRMRDWFKEIF